MNGPDRTFILVGTIIILLLAMNHLPTLSIDGTDLRKVEILSDIIPSKDSQNDDAGLLPKVPDAPVAEENAPKNMPPFKEVRPKGVTMIDDYSAGKPGGMDNFYRQLSRIKQLDRPVRIAYYGDSFVEGDVLTCDLREMLQQKFGGSGVGWVDCASEIAKLRPTVVLNSTGLSINKAVKKPFNASLQGISQSYFTAGGSAKVSLAGAKYKKFLNQWETSTLYFRTRNGLSIGTSVNGAAAKQQRFAGSSAVQTAQTKGTTSRIAYSFSGMNSGTQLFGAALESKSGVILDNFGMRAATGMTISAIPAGTLKDFARLRPYDLIIIHFGLNVADPRNTSAFYKNYINNMKKAISNLRQAYPEAAILVVSVPDRDQKTAEGITTVKGLEAFISWQKLMASDMKVSFFNLFNAMGGKGSMKQLVDRKLASKDYTHLSFGGGKIIAGKFFASLMAGYDNYVKREEYYKQK